MNRMRPAGLGLVVTLLGLLGSYVLARHQAEATAHVETARFVQAANSLTESLSRRIDAYTEIAFGLRSLFHVNPALDRRAFVDSVARLDLSQRHAEIKNIAFTRYVRAQDKARFERQVREDTSIEPGGYPDFRIHPPGDRDEYFVADYLWPMAGNPGIHGLDISAQPANLASMHYSQRTMEPVASGPFDLLQEATNRSGFVIRVPVFRQHQAGAAVHPPEFLGSVAVTLRVWDVFQSLQREGRLQGLNVRLTDQGSRHVPQTPVQGKLMFEQIRAGDTLDARHGRELNVYGRVWQLDFSPAQPFLTDAERLTPWLAGLSGALVSVLLGLLVHLLARGRSHALEQVAQTGEALRLSEDRWRFALEGAGDGVWDFNLETGDVYFSRRCGQMLGYNDTADAHARAWMRRIHREDLRRVLHVVRHQLHPSQDAISLEFRMRCSDGHWKWILGRGMAFGQWRGGQPTRLIGTLSDITERKAADEALRVAAAAFESQEAIIITDARSVVLRINPAFSEVTGYTAGEIIGKSPRLLQSGRHDKSFYDAMWKTLAQTGKWKGEVWNRRKNGEIYPEWLAISAVKGPDGRVSHYVGVHTDITLRKAAEEEIKQLAFFDPLTKLPNRRLLHDRLQRALSASHRTQQHGAVLFIDLDNFKTLNDSQGHAKGDLLLQLVAQRLGNCIREDDTVARLGGDEFVVVLEGLSPVAADAATRAEEIGEKIIQHLNQAYDLGGRAHHTTPSIGITLFGLQRETPDDLLKRADIAMYQAKSAGRNTLRFFDPGVQATVSRRAALETDLRQGLSAGQFVAHYQAQVQNGQIIGAELLLRWDHPVQGLVPPAQFISLAEETALILPLGQWVIRAACEQLVQWAQDPYMRKLSVAINVSARQFQQSDFVGQVLQVLADTGADAHRLKIEITESLLLNNVEDSIVKIDALRAKGIGFSLDDFGTGYSSLAYLKRLPLEQIKIDRSFVRDLLVDASNATIVRAIITLGKSLGIQVIAEGVETSAQHEYLIHCGCDAYQGYLFARPCPADALRAAVIARMRTGTAPSAPTLSAPPSGA